MKSSRPDLLDESRRGETHETHEVARRPGADLAAMTLSNRFVRATIEATERLGIPRASLLSAAGLDVTQVEAVEGRVSIGDFSKLCELALDLSGDPALGLHAGELMTGGSFNIVTPLVAHAASMRQGFETLARIHPLLGDKRRYEISEHDHHVTLRCASLDGASERVRSFVAELELVGFWRMIAYFCPGAHPEIVSFEHAAPAHRREYSRAFNGLGRFDQPFTGIVFDRALLDVPSVFRDETLNSALRKLAEHRIARIAQADSHAKRVRDYLAQSDATTDMAVVARALRLSVRSLRRRLAAERTSYQALVNEALAEVAKRRLLVEGWTIQETALAMGYATSAAFHRAFKRWTGITPRAFIAKRNG